MEARVSISAARRYPWGLTQALELVNRLRPSLLEKGWSVGLHGSVLYNGSSLGDLDLIFYPLDSSNRKTTHRSLREVLSEQGLTPVYSVQKVHAVWRRNGSRDKKHVEVWAYDGRKVDVFIMR